MNNVACICILLYLGSFCSSRAESGADELASFVRGPDDVSRSVHVVHLRTGTVDVDAEHQRLPALTPAARRLLQQPGPVPTTSPEWGPLAGAQLWLLALGPELHVHQGQQPLHGRPAGHRGPTSSASAAHGETGALGAAAQPDFAELQAALLARLHAAGCAVVSFLPPAAWLLAVAAHADLAAVREEYPDIRLAPYASAGRRVSPELGAALAAARGVEAAAAELPAGGEPEELLLPAGGQAVSWVRGALRLHSPTRAAGQQRQQQLAGLSEGQEAGAGGPRPARVLVEVHFPHLEPQDLAYMAEAEAAAGGPYHPASAAAADWLAPLTAISPPSCPPLLFPDSGSPELLLVAVCPEGMGPVVAWLEQAPQVSWLSPRMSSRLHNLIAGAITQTGGNTAAANNATAPSAHPFWMAGITGRNQIVGCGDSGIDTGNCFFNDPAVSFTQNIQTDSSGQQYFLSDSHRKLRYYLAVVQDTFDGFGHGTHVSGTLVGSRYDRSNAAGVDPLDAGTGQAPAAKIAFMDLSRGSGDGVWTPGDLARSYFNLTYRVGARVHSDSWGSDLTAYDTMAAALDRFTWANQDFVSVVAAGNYGSNSGANTTITSPAVAKNCITAGATLSAQSSADRPTSYGVAVLNMTATLTLAGGQAASRSVRVVGAGFGGSLADLVPANTPLAVASPADACSSLSNAGSVAGRVVLVVRGGCYFTDKMKTAAAAGAAGVIVYNNLMDGYFQMTSSDSAATSGATVPMASVPHSTATWLQAALNAGTVAVTFRRLSTEVQPGFEDVASYSSFGPTTDGRIKPDIVAPGYLLSAQAATSLLPDNQLPSCGASATKYLQGTSMATPVIAGSALLVRQYFTDGYYPDGRPNASAGFTPSGALIKAVMIGGAHHMTGSVSGTGMPLEDAPSYRQGFGRLDLMHSLPLPVPSSPGWRLQVVDGASLAQGQQHSFCVQAAGGPLRITLAWYDYPGDPAALRALVNNLDLTVRAAGRSGLTDYGNGVQDAVNTVEQVWYDDLAAGDVAITVSAPVVYAKAVRQPYALVVQGKFSGTLRAPVANDSSSASCAVQLAVIDPDLSAPLLTNRKDASFYFATSDGSSATDGFECRLTLESGVPGVNATAYNASVSADWSSCSSPRKYSGLLDGRYSFQVRVKGEQVAASRSLTVDTTPPVTTLTSSLPPPASGATVAATPTDNATFTFVATDVSTVINFTCYLSFANGPAGQSVPPRLRQAVDVAAANDTAAAAASGGSAAVAVGEWFSCRSPLSLLGLSFGDYSLQVLAYDAVKNPETTPKSLSWKIRYSPGVDYARIASGPSGLVAARSLTYSVVGLRGAPAVDSPPLDETPGSAGAAAYEAALLAGNASLAAVPASNWSRLAAATVKLTAPVDGSYLAAVRPVGAADVSTWAAASVVVDTTPPVVAVIRKPAAIQSDARVTITFGDAGPEGEIRAYFCRWLGPATAPPDPATPDTGAAAFAACSGSSTANVTEGFWLFQVKGRDAAGNLGAPTDVPFRTDLSAPAIVAPVPPAIAATRVAWNFSVDDGPTGTGVVNVSCSFKWVYLVDITNVSKGDATYPAGSPSASWVQPCANPARYTVQEGSYLWSIAATDGAGLRNTADFPLVIDFTPPVSRVFASSLPSNRALPSKLTIGFASSDKPDASPSGIAEQQCLLESVAAPPPSSPPPAPPKPPAPPLPPLPPGSRVASLSSPPTVPASSGGGRRRLAQAPSAAANATMNGTPVTLGVWHVCDSTGSGQNATYANLSTGYYAFRVRAVDRAGNAGSATSPYFFTVDASLPEDGSTTISSGGSGDSDRTKQIVIGVLILVGAVIAIAIALGVIYARRRALRKRYGAPPVGMAAAAVAGSNGGGIAMQAYGPYGNGTSNGGQVPVVGNGSYAVQPAASASPVLPFSPTGGSAGAPSAPVQGVPYYPPVPPAGDPALAAALAASQAAAAEAERARAAAAEAEEAERMRRAIAASLEEENIRRAMEASLAAAQRDGRPPPAAAPVDPEQAALDAAIAASLRSAEEEARRQHAALRAQLQQQPGGGSPRPPSESLI